MAQRDYILQMFEEIGRMLAQIIYQRQIKDYEAAHALLDEQFKQAVGMGRGFLYALSDETLLAMLSTMGVLNADKCWLVATLLKIDGDIYADQENESESFRAHLKACNLFLEALQDGKTHKEIEPVSEIEELLGTLEEYELPWHTQELLFWYFEATGRFGKAEDTLFELLEMGSAEPEEHVEDWEELLERGEAFYARLLGKSNDRLSAGNFSRSEIAESLERLHLFYL